MTPAFLLAAMLGVAPVLDTLQVDRGRIECSQFQHFETRFDCMTYNGMQDVFERLRALEADTIGYWLQPNTWSGAPDTVWVMRKR